MIDQSIDDPFLSLQIRKFFALAPVAAIGHIEGLIAFLGRYFGGNLWMLRHLFGTHDFMPHNWLTSLFARVICGERWETPLCDNVMFQIGGPESAQFNQVMGGIQWAFLKCQKLMAWDSNAMDNLGWNFFDKM
jgi:hypothetical protein